MPILRYAKIRRVKTKKELLIQFDSHHNTVFFFWKIIHNIFYRSDFTYNVCDKVEIAISILYRYTDINL